MSWTTRHRPLSRSGSFALVLTYLVGCADNPPAPIEDRTGYGARPAKTAAAKPAQQAVTETPRINAVAGMPYVVQKGDTLYAIAFSLEMDYRTLASINGIEAPYTIYIGQRIETDPKRSKQSEKAGSSKVAKTVTTQAPRSTSPSVAPAASTTTPSSTGSPAKSSASKSSGSNAATVAATTVAKTTTTVAVAAPKPAAPAVSKPTGSSTPVKSKPVKSTPAIKPKLGRVDRWLWPGPGKVVRGYSSTLHKGLDLAGSRGDPVRATAPGVVVYTGTGVKGYGALVIVKHNDTYLSAYGHNDAILVEEGTLVNAGEQIARMGSTGTDNVKLYFEIRKQGKPVNPTTLLPKR